LFEKSPKGWGKKEFALLDLLLVARDEAGLSQAQVAERMGLQAHTVARLERALASGVFAISYDYTQPSGILWQAKLMVCTCPV